MKDQQLTPTGAFAVTGALYGADAREGALARGARALASPAALLALCALSVAFFWKSILLHQILLPADILYAKDPLWMTPIPHPPAANPLDSDTLTEFYPWTALAAGALHKGIIPLWNPYSFAGAPFLGAMQTAVLYPVNVILELLLPPADVLGARAAVHLAVTLTGTFLFARRLGLSRLAALLAALVFGLGLPYVVWLEHPMSGAVAWLPWLLLAIDHIIAARRPLWPVALGAAVVALEILSGHGESTAHALLLCAAYTIFRAAWIWRRDRRDTPRALIRAPLLALIALALGLAIAAAHLGPALAQIPHSEAAADRTLALPSTWSIARGDPALWKTLVVALIPDFFGNPTWHVSALPLAFGYNELALYIGTAPLLLAALAMIYQRRKAPVIFFGLAALVAVGMAVRLPGFALLDSLPILRITANGRLRMEYAFCMAILAGYGLDGLVEAMRQAAPWPWRLLGLWALGLAACAALGARLLLSIHPNGYAVPPGTAARVAIPLVWLAGFAALLWLYRRGALRPAILRGLVLALCAADLFSQGVGYHETVSRGSAAAVPQAVRAVQRDHSLYRVAGLGTALWPSLSSLYGLQDVRGYDPAYNAAYERYFAASFGSGGMRLALADAGPSPAGARALDLMNVKYLFASCLVRLNTRYYRPVFRQGDGCVYRNLSAMPRAVVVHDIVWAPPRKAAALLDSGAVDPRATVLLDPSTATRGAWAVADASPAGPSDGQDTARVTEYGLNTVAVSVHAARRGALVLSDAYAPGWTARVDGRPAALARADGDFRAVALTAGTHDVTFTYRPLSFTVGVIISAAALALWLLLAALALRTRLTRPRPAIASTNRDYPSRR